MFDVPDLNDINYLMSELELNECRRVGLYKLSRSIIAKFMPQNLSSGRNITSCELELLLFFCRIADSTGYIEHFHYSEVTNSYNQGSLKMNIKSYYNALRGLSVKGFIVLNASEWGFYNITILNDRFDSPEDDKKGYLDLNRDFLEPSDPKYLLWKKLSLNAKKLLLFLLSGFNFRKGMSKNISELKELLMIGCKTKILNYFREIDKLFPGMIKLLHRYKRAKGIGIMPMTNTGLKTGVSSCQLTWLKRMCECICSITGALKDARFPDLLYNQLIELFSIYKDKFSITDILKCIIYHVSDSGRLGLSELFQAKLSLNISFTN